MTQTITINLKSGDFSKQPVSDDDVLIGGRALSSRLVAELVPPEADPIGPFNILAICCGVLAGTTVSNGNRISVGAKSPLTGTIKESNSGGTFAYSMGRLGLRSIVIEDQPDTPGDWKIIVIDAKTIRFEDGNDLSGLGCHEKAERIVSRFGRSIAYAMIGPGGEALMRASAIAVSDPQLLPSRFCGRGGMGAVMGSKYIQAIILDTTETSPIKPLDPERFKETNKTIIGNINATPQTAKVFRVYGTAAMVDTGQGLGFLPTRNFSQGRFDEFEKINGESLLKMIEERGGVGKASHACMPGCMVQCSNVFPDKEGKRLVSPLEYETIGMMGPNLGIGDLDTVAQMNYLANDAGVDTVEVGAAIGVAMQAGLAEFGDKAAALNFMQEIRDGSIIGRLLGSGAETVARVLGVYQVPTAKGQAFPAYDPRGLKGLAATYATSPMGADHTAGHTIRSAVDDHHSPVGQAEASKQSQVGVLQWDSLGFCYFIGSAVPDLALICELIASIHGQDPTPQQIRQLAVETLKIERKFNRDAGFGPAHDRLSEYFHLTKNPDTGTICDIPEDDIKDIMNDEKLS